MGEIVRFEGEYYAKLLQNLRKTEQEMGLTPILKDWLTIRNKIRTVERMIKEIKTQKNT